MFWGPEKKASEPQDKKVTDIENRFTYHPPVGDQKDRYEVIRGEAKEFAFSLTQLCPESRELSLALTHLEQAVFWANASIARNGEKREVTT